MRWRHQIPPSRGYSFDGPIDAVYTWVDNSDPDWRARLERALGTVDTQHRHPTATALARFVDHDELKFSLRSLVEYAPWIRHIYLVTDRQVPQWLTASTPGLTVVDHTELLPDEDLPTFNSHVIETALHRIPGLSEHYLYFNDDVMLGAPASPDDFFTSDGKVRVFPSPKGITGELPVLQAAQRNAQIMWELTGAEVKHRYRHTPHPQLVSVCAELEAAIPDEMARTRSHTFRHPDDVSFASSLTLSYAVATGRGVESDIDYAYVDISSKRAVLDLLKLGVRGPRRVVCINQVGRATRPVTWLLSKVMNRLWPQRSPFERSRTERRKKGAQ